MKEAIEKLKALKGKNESEIAKIQIAIPKIQRAVKELTEQNIGLDVAIAELAENGENTAH